MNQNTNESPPGFILKFFRWYCHPSLKDFIEGDLLEVYDRRIKSFGKAKANLLFALDVVLLFQPGIIRPINRKLNVNHTSMFRSYFKIGWRNLSRNKGYTFINIGGLALSMACGILIFTFVKYHLSFDNFHDNPDRIYKVVTELHRDVIAYRSHVPSPLGEVFRNDYNYADKVARVYRRYSALITLREDGKTIKYNEDAGVAFAETTFFDIFNFPILRGDRKSMLTEENTAFVTETIARKYFADEDPIGKTFWLENKFPFTITGVLKDLPSNTDLKSGIFLSYVSLKSYDPSLAGEISGWNGIWDGMQCYMLLRPGIRTDQVESAMAPYVKKFRPTTKNIHVYKLLPISSLHFDEHYGGAMQKKNLWILSVVGLFLIATACVNFINLATAQALKRSKEVGVRKVLGSQKAQLFWQFIFETGMITATGMLVAMGLAYIILPYADGLFSTHMSINPFTDLMLVYFVIALGVLVTFLAGYYPALVLAQFQPVTALKGKLTQQTIGGFNTRRILIVSQFAISQVLIIGMVVVINQIRFASEADLGFNKDAIVMINAGIDTTGRVSVTLKNEIARLTDVEKVSLCFAAPSSENDWGNSVKFDNSSEEVNFRTSIKCADADYAGLFDLKFVAGRNITPSDTAREMMVNETFLNKVGIESPDEAIGRIIVANGGQMKAPIVGVIKDFHDKSFHEDINPIMITTHNSDYENIAVKLNLATAKATLVNIEKLWSEQHPDEIFQYEFVDDSIARFYQEEETMLSLIKTFSVISIFIGCLGLYGLVSFMITQKTKEIGIRKVLGGNVTNILMIFGKEFFTLILIAFAIAGPIGWWLMNAWLQTYKFKINIGIGVFASAIVCSIAVALITVSYRVAKAAYSNPVNSLKVE